MYLIFALAFLVSLCFTHLACDELGGWGAKLGSIGDSASTDISCQDMTAFIARNATETIGFIGSAADEKLTKWLLGLAKEYISIPADVFELPG